MNREKALETEAYSRTSSRIDRFWENFSLSRSYLSLTKRSYSEPRGERDSFVRETNLTRSTRFAVKFKEREVRTSAGRAKRNKTRFCSRAKGETWRSRQRKGCFAKTDGGFKGYPSTKLLGTRERVEDGAPYSDTAEATPRLLLAVVWVSPPRVERVALAMAAHQRRQPRR